MSLVSHLFAGDKLLEACAVQDSAHLLKGSRGDHVSKVQTAVSRIDGYTIAADEIYSRVYGASTAAAILAFKTRRNIINPAYQNKPDNIVGKRTIVALDRELAILESNAKHNDARDWTVR